MDAGAVISINEGGSEYIYILVNPAYTNYVKIGKTIKDPHLRAKEVSAGTGVPAPFAVVWDIRVKNCEQVERIIHQELSPYRSRNDREFFSLSPKKAIALVSKITESYADVDPEEDLPLASDIKVTQAALFNSNSSSSPRAPIPRGLSKESKKLSSSRAGLPQVQKASDFEELKEILAIRSEHIPSCYFDRLFLDNNKPISRILEEDWWPYAETIGDNHFPSIGKVKAHVKFRAERGWQYEISGTPGDPIYRLVGLDVKSTAKGPK